MGDGRLVGDIGGLSASCSLHVVSSGAGLPMEFQTMLQSADMPAESMDVPSLLVGTSEEHFDISMQAWRNCRSAGPDRQISIWSGRFNKNVGPGDRQNVK
ncbi:hypothetical protein DPMN_001459 [Dreissena polymorpha]|uniref:Uncharacterized protein n=1 Tax=Dreissena polymorpha TaxID=45954 RepID=A0A9D4MKY6_DREPO|nr:hypothetical protein DPMN_001459 [Dreissena polymorpha]